MRMTRGMSTLILIFTWKFGCGEGQRDGKFSHNGELGHSCVRVRKVSFRSPGLKIMLCI